MLRCGANPTGFAAHALSLGLTLVTDNVDEFRRVKGLTLGNWLAG
jgi:tRNA(fMet)-specific endonuclease VapC